MKNIEVTDEEFELIARHRKEEFKNSFLHLEQSFKEAISEVQNQIEEHLTQAQFEVGEAVKLSEQSGVPFALKLVGDPQRYIPMTFHEKWGRLPNCELAKIDLNFDDITSVGWEYWSPSTLHC